MTYRNDKSKIGLQKLGKMSLRLPTEVKVNLLNLRDRLAEKAKIKQQEKR